MDDGVALGVVVVPDGRGVAVPVGVAVLIARTGVLVGDGVAVGGAGVLVGDGVAVEGMRVLVPDGVSVAGTGVLVTDGLAVAGTGVSVSIAVPVALSTGGGELAVGEGDTRTSVGDRVGSGDGCVARVSVGVGVRGNPGSGRDRSLNTNRLPATSRMAAMHSAASSRPPTVKADLRDTLAPPLGITHLLGVTQTPRRQRRSG